MPGPHEDHPSAWGDGRALREVAPAALHPDARLHAGKRRSMCGVFVVGVNRLAHSVVKEREKQRGIWQRITRGVGSCVCPSCPPADPPPIFLKLNYVFLLIKVRPRCRGGCLERGRCGRGIQSCRRAAHLSPVQAAPRGSKGEGDGRGAVSGITTDASVERKMSTFDVSIRLKLYFLLLLLLLLYHFF